MELRKKNRILGWVALAISVISMTIGIVESLNPSTKASGNIIILMGVVGVILSFMDIIVLKISKKDTPFLTLLFLNVAVFLATFPGEIFNAYYAFWWWDMFLHLVCGFGIALAVFQILEIVFEKQKVKPPKSFLIFIAITMALGGAVIWETIEYSIDSIFHTNMQKFIPDEFLPDDVSSVTELNATSEEIAEFYAKPEGFRFALIDTMEDHICYFAGALIWAGVQIAWDKSKKSKK